MAMANKRFLNTYNSLFTPINPEQFSKIMDLVKSYTVVSGVGRFTEEMKQNTIKVLTKIHDYLWGDQLEENNNNNNEIVYSAQEITNLQKELNTILSLWVKEFSCLTTDFNILMNMVSSGQKMLASALEKLEEKEEALMDLESTQETRIFNYGKDMKVLIQLIETNKDKFIKMPKGPLGSCISARGKTWLKLLETLLDPYLWLFIVDNQKDCELLNGMIDKVFGQFVPIHMFEWKRPEVWITKFDSCQDVKKIEKINGHFTILDSIIIHNEDLVVEKTLWQMLPIGHILLFKTQHEAFPEVSEESCVPKYCVMAYTLDFFKVYPYPTFRTSKIEPKENGILTYSAGNVALRVCKQGIKEGKASIQVMKTSISNAKHSMIKASESIHSIKKIVSAFDSLYGLVLEQVKKNPVQEEDMNNNNNNLTIV